MEGGAFEIPRGASEWLRGSGWGGEECDGLAFVGHPPLDPSSGLRVSGPSPGMDSRLLGNDGRGGFRGWGVSGEWGA